MFILLCLMKRNVVTRLTQLLGKRAKLENVMYSRYSCPLTLKLVADEFVRN